MDAPGACPRGGIGNNTQLWLMYSVNLIESRHRGHWFPRQTRERERERERGRERERERGCSRSLSSDRFTLRDEAAFD